MPSKNWIHSKRYTLIEASLIGVTAALAAVVLRDAVGALGGVRVQWSYLVTPWLVLPWVGVMGGLLSGILVDWVSPEAAGSGIPQVKAALGYIPMPLNWKVALVKLLSSILALAAGVALGRQGPTVHIGAAIGAQMSRWLPTSPDHRRQLIAAGAAAGLAAGFNTPMAGVVFVIEELLQDVSSLTLGTAILASFIGAVVSRLLGGDGQSLEQVISTSSPIANVVAQDIPFLMGLGVLAGVLAAVFNGIAVAGGKQNLRLRRIPRHWKMALVCGLTGLVMAGLPSEFRDRTGLQVFLTMGEASWQVALTSLSIQLVLTLAACWVETPGGLFAPSLLLGSSLGQMVGLWVQSGTGLSHPSLYALSGMGAVFGAVAKVPFTAVVIVFELTTDFNLVLPLMICCATAYLVSEKLQPGSLYTRLLALKGIHLNISRLGEDLWIRLKAKDVMQSTVETLSSQMRLDEVKQAFARSHHRGFPVMESGRVVGIITQTDLTLANQRGLTADTPLYQVMTPDPITVSPQDSLAQVLDWFSRFKLSRLPVTEHRKLVGIITRSDILQVEAEHLHGSRQTRAERSYLVYQTRGPATGKGCILLPVSHPKTAPWLLKLALALAKANHYEVDCLHVVRVPPHCIPSEIPVDLHDSHQLLAQADQIGRENAVSVHTQVRVSHSVEQAVLDALQDHPIDLLIMGWKGQTSKPDRVLGDTVDILIRQASCDVVLVKLDPRFVSGLRPFPSFDRWLVPLGGGQNAQQAVQLLPALADLSPDPSLHLCQIFAPGAAREAGLESRSLRSGSLGGEDPAFPTQLDTELLNRNAAFLEPHFPSRVQAVAVCARDIAASVLDLAVIYQSDVILLGASQEGLLQQVVQGNIPEAISRQAQCSVMVVRKGGTGLDPLS